MIIREVKCKSILSKSGLADYCLNCYIGCQHACRYCYARFMKKYTEHEEPWGQFVDVKINAPEILEKEVKKKQKGEVFISSVCDGWQPLEEKYNLTRRCLEILLKNGFSATILTKSRLVERDFDLMCSYEDKVELGVTIISLEDRIRNLFEPLASSPGQRVSLLEKAVSRGISSYAFLGPLLPHLSDKETDLEKLFMALQYMGLDAIYVDRLNPRYGVWESVSQILRIYHAHLIPTYRMILFDKKSSRMYSASLRNRVMKSAFKYGLDDKVKLCF